MTPLFIALNVILAAATVVGIVGLLAAGISAGRPSSDAAVEPLAGSAPSRLAA